MTKSKYNNDTKTQLTQDHDSTFIIVVVHALILDPNGQIFQLVWSSETNKQKIMSKVLWH